MSRLPASRCKIAEVRRCKVTSQPAQSSQAKSSQVARQVQAKNIENLHCDQADNWTSTGIIRYRSRRDCAETLLDTFGSNHHGDKLAALEKTLAFPVTTSLLMGSPRVLMAMGLALIAALTQILIL